MLGDRGQLVVARDPEVGDAEVAAGVEQQVRRLEVAVDDARRVRRVERAGRLGEPAQRVVAVDGAGADAVGERPPVRSSETMKGRPSQCRRRAR